MKSKTSERTLWGLALHSTGETVRTERTTLLAIFEVIIGSALLATLVSYRQEFIYSYLPIVTLLVLGPLSLQKTEWSTAFSLKYYDGIERATPRVNAWQEKPTRHWAVKELRLFVGFAFFLVIVPMWMWLIRPISVVRSWFSGHFLDSIFAIPKNWYRTVFVLDLVYPPEAVPGIDERREPALYRCKEHFWNSFETLKQEQATRGTLFKIAYIFAWLLQWAIIFLPGVVLRLSVKSTALIWAPITALIWWRAPTPWDLGDKVDYILHDAREKAYRWAVVPFHLIFSLALPVGLFVYHLYSSSFLPPNTSGVLATLLGLVHWSTGFNIVTRKFDAIEFWGICSVVNAVVTMLLASIASMEARRERRQLLPLPSSNTQISSLLLLRTLIAVFLIFKPLRDLLPVLIQQGHGAGETVVGVVQRASL